MSRCTGEGEGLGVLDGRALSQLGELADVASDADIVPLEVSFEAVTTRYIKVHVYNRETPEGYGGAGNPAWLRTPCPAAA